MRPSAKQFELLVNFMKEHGDLTKPSNTAQGRIRCIRNWERLTHLLNSVPSGDSKTSAKWRKAWSDLKNNTKKKAAKIRAASCGGGRGLQTRLSKLERQILQLAEAQAAARRAAVVEAGVPQEIKEEPELTSTLSQTPPAPEESSSLLPTMIAEHVTVIDMVPFEKWATPGTSEQYEPEPFEQVLCEVEKEEVLCATRPPVTSQSTAPANEGETPGARCEPPPRRFVRPLRRLQRINVEHVSDNCLRCGEKWRNFLVRKHDDEMKLEMERLRLREMELQNQQGWQEITITALDALHKVINSNLCSD